MVFGDGERFWIFQIFLAGLCQTQYTVVFYLFGYVTVYHGLANHGVQQRHFVAGNGTECVEFFEVVRFDFGRLFAAQNVDDDFGFEFLFAGGDGFEHGAEQLLCLNLFFGVQTVVAVAAVLFGVLFAKVVEQHFAAAYRRFGVGGCFVE